MSDRVAVVIASAHRPQVLQETVASLMLQSEPAAEIIISVPGSEHVTAETAQLPSVKIVRAELSATRQRNRAIDAIASDAELVAFLDDDVELRRDYLEALRRSFGTSREVAFLRGHMIANGMDIGPIDRAGARAMVGSDAATHSGAAAPPQLVPITCIDAFGATMSVRRAVLQTARFDERLPLYSYMEDLDFAAQCTAYGRLAYCHNARLVHLYAPGGRLPGLCIGFAQVMNPAYLWRKGTCPTGFLLRRLAQHLAANALKSLHPRHSTPDRRARLAGNLRAVRSLLRGRIAPEDMAALSPRADPCSAAATPPGTPG
jgi:GT2 family glycosyltransferase